MQLKEVPKINQYFGQKNKTAEFELFCCFLLPLSYRQQSVQTFIFSRRTQDFILAKGSGIFLPADGEDAKKILCGFSAGWKCGKRTFCGVVFNVWFRFLQFLKLIGYLIYDDL